MNFKRKKMPKIIYKAGIVLVGGTLVALAFMVNIDTSSWFTSEVQQEMKVTAATTEDIIHDFKIIENNDGSKKIKIKKAQGIDYAPEIFFKVEGDIAEYTRQINPVTLDRKQEYFINIQLNINNGQFNKLKSYPHDEITGTISLMYLNRYIDEERDLRFSKDYLISEFDRVLNRIGNKEVVNLMEYMAQFINWENEERSSEKLESRVTTTNISNTKSEDSNESTAEYIMPNINKIMLSPYQNQILYVIAPKLIPHTERLYATIENLSVTLNEKISEIELLNQFIEECKAKIEALNKEKILLENNKAALTENVEALENTNAVLNENIAELNKKVKKLNNNIDILSDSNKNLKSENSSLLQDLNTLTIENITLKEEIETFKLQIEELTTKENNDITVPEEVYGN